MGKGRIEAFSDGVIAIIITIMVLELRAPLDGSLASLQKLTPIFVAYLLSFLVAAIMWVNHHNLIQAAPHATVRLLWLNIHLLFWMSLVPFATAYVGHHYAESLPAALYAMVHCGCALGFLFLRCEAIPRARWNPRATAKNVISIALYSSAAPLAYVSPYLSYGIFVLIPVLYFLPERIRTADEAG